MFGVSPSLPKFLALVAPMYGGNVHDDYCIMITVQLHVLRFFSRFHTRGFALRSGAIRALGIGDYFSPTRSDSRRSCTQGSREIKIRNSAMWVVHTNSALFAPEVVLQPYLSKYPRVNFHRLFSPKTGLWGLFSTLSIVLLFVRIKLAHEVIIRINLRVFVFLQGTLRWFR